MLKLLTQAGNTQKLETFESDNGFIAVKMTMTEKANIQVQYKGTTLMMVSSIISALTLIGMIIMILFEKHRQPK